MPMGETHALVVGISNYKNLGRANHAHKTYDMKQLTCAAMGALRFHDWLTKVYNNPNAPLGYNKLLLSLSDEEVQALSAEGRKVNALKPETHVVRKALLEWWRACSTSPDNVAILYLAGHGVRVDAFEDRNIALLYDFADDDLVFSFSIDVNSLFRGMNGATFAIKQFFFIDTCRLDVDLFSGEHYGQGLTVPFNFKGPEKRIAPKFMSTIPGDEALGEPVKGSVFSQCLLSALNGSAVLGGSTGESVVTIASLKTGLEKEMNNFCQDEGINQMLSFEGTDRSAVFHVQERPNQNQLRESICTPKAILRKRTELPENFVQPCDTRLTEKVLNPLSNGELDTIMEDIDPSEDLNLMDVSERASVIVRGRKHTFELEQMEEYLGMGDNVSWWWWSIRLKCSNAALALIESVTYQLHRTFHVPSEKLESEADRERHFSIERTGYGEFAITARIKITGEKEIELKHWLQLHDENGDRCED